MLTIYRKQNILLLIHVKTNIVLKYTLITSFFNVKLNLQKTMRKILMFLAIAFFAFNNAKAASDKFLDDFEADTISYFNENWGGSQSVVINPLKTGNTSEKVLKYEPSGAWQAVKKWCGSNYVVSKDYAKISVDVYVTSAVNVQLILGNSTSGAGNFQEVKAATVGSWVTLEWDITGLTAWDFQQIAFQNSENVVIYFDNFKVIAKPPIPFDLSTFEGDVPSGTEIVTIDNIQYLKVQVNGWNTTLEIKPITVDPTNLTTVSFSYKFDKDTSTYAGDMQAFFQFVNSSWAVKKAITDNPVSLTFKELSGELLADTFSKLQVAAQGTSGDWPAVVGPVFYISKLQITTAEKWLEVPISKLIVGKVNDAADYKGALKMKWDNDSVYMKFNIVDDSITIPFAGQYGTNNYACDNIEVYFDMDNSKNIHWPRNGGWVNADPTFDENDFQLRLNPDYDPAFSIGSGALATDPRVVYTKTSNGYTFVMNVAWNSLKAGFVPAAGTKIGFDVLLSDNDIADSEEDRNQITIVSTIDKAFNDPSLWGTFELLADGTFKIVKDTEAPSAPANLKAEVDQDNVTLSWDASTDNIAVLSYNIAVYSNGVLDTIYVAYPEAEGALSYTETNVENGTYKIVVTAQDNYGNKSAASETTAVVYNVGIKDASFASLNIFPNPATEYISINNTENASVQVFNTTGQLVLVKSIAAHEKINVSTLNDGIFTVRITENNNVSIVKMIKK